MLSHNPTAAQLAAQLAGLPGVRAVVLGGSRAQGRARPDSDTDLGLYYDAEAPFDVAAVRELAARVAVSPPTVTGFYEWGAWVNGGAWIQTPHGKIDLLYRERGHVTRAIATASTGHIDVDFLQQPPYGFVSITYLAETAICVPLADPHGDIAVLKAQVASFPEGLHLRWAKSALWMTEFSLMHARGYAARGDVLNTAGTLARCVMLLTQSLYALNRVYFINDKHAAADLARFAICPVGFVDRLSALLGTVGQDPATLSRSVEAMTVLFAEVSALAA
ncbi:MAG: nucleotidyltransferase domain-containing protein [Anaerolineales bacterium]|nr:nucleotidyltransferase domain-containing protein [Anaerolineales bacterium]